MFVDERHEKIMLAIRAHGRVTVLELTQSLAVSEATIRRDLTELEQQGLIKRAHGGAVLNIPSNQERSFSEKNVELLTEKQGIAALAADVVRDGDVILLDSGTTTLQMVPHIAHKKITVITNSILIAEALAVCEGIELLMVGGRHRGITRAFVGHLADAMLKTLHADKVFMGTNGLDVEGGFSTPNEEEAGTKSAMIAASDEVFVLCDHSKFNKSLMVRFAEVKDVDCVITDSKAPLVSVQSLQDKGVRVLSAHQ